MESCSSNCSYIHGLKAEWTVVLASYPVSTASFFLHAGKKSGRKAGSGDWVRGYCAVVYSVDSDNPVVGSYSANCVIIAEQAVFTVSS